jgi:hypothetical protein
MESCAFMISYWSRVSDACRLSEEVLECELARFNDECDARLVAGSSGGGGRKPCVSNATSASSSCDVQPVHPHR